MKSDDLIYDNSKNILSSKIKVTSVDIWDETLRDGEQASGVHFPISGKLEIAKLLSDIGVKVIDVGMPIISRSERKAISTIAGEGLKSDIGVTVRANKEDIRYAIDCNVDRVHLFYPTSRLHLKYKLNIPRTQEEAKSVIIEMIDYIKDHGLRVDFIPEDSSRTNPEFLIDLLSEIKLDLESIMICDTVAYLLPDTTYDFTRNIIEAVGSDVLYGCHMHNDLGLATANTLSAIYAGAKLPTVTVNGIGERAGNAPLEQVVAGLKRTGINSGIKTEMIKELSDLVEKTSGILLPVNQPIVGRHAFSHESGIHVKAMLSNTQTYEPLRPEDFGRQREYVIGKHSGRDYIIKKLKEFGIELNDKQFEEFFKRIKTRRIITQRDIEAQIKEKEYFNDRFFGIPEEELMRLIGEVLDNNHENG